MPAKALAPRPWLTGLDWVILGALPTGIAVGAVVGVVRGQIYTVPAVMVAGLANLAWYVHATSVNLMQAIRAGEREDVPAGSGQSGVVEERERALRLERARDDYKAHFLPLLGFAHYFGFNREYGKSAEARSKGSRRPSPCRVVVGQGGDGHRGLGEGDNTRVPVSSREGPQGSTSLTNHFLIFVAAYVDWLLLLSMAIGLTIAIPLGLISHSKYARLAVWIGSIANMAWFWQDSAVNLVQSVWGARREREEAFFFMTPKITNLARAGRTRRLKCGARYVTTLQDLFLPTYALLRLPESANLASRIRNKWNSMLRPSSHIATTGMWHMRQSGVLPVNSADSNRLKTTVELKAGDRVLIYQASHESQLARLPDGNVVSIVDYDEDRRQILFSWSDRDAGGDVLEVTLDVRIEMRMVDSRAGRRSSYSRAILAVDIALFLSVPSLLLAAFVTSIGILSTSVEMSVGLALISNLMWLFRGYPVNLVHGKRESRIKRALSIAHEAEGAAKDMSLVYISVGASTSYVDWFFPLTGLLGNSFDSGSALMTELRKRNIYRGIADIPRNRRNCLRESLYGAKESGDEVELYHVQQGTVFVAWIHRDRLETMVDGSGPIGLETRAHAGVPSRWVAHVMPAKSKEREPQSIALLLTGNVPFGKWDVYSINVQVEEN